MSARRSLTRGIGELLRLLDPGLSDLVRTPQFETLQHASRVIGDWIQFYNQKRPHQALKMKTPAQAYAEAA
ncbi:integrase core domain-containing protein [Aeromonas caviae]|uniref:integrase core domain-containing protein n=1 Tax=Aeromonas caviae TaxID=648 RepID=UPI002B47DF82|nr:integrase core domain-containing protein [Aeromonas caviae]